VVPRFGHSAVQRNRVRRRLREIARIDWLPVALEKGLLLDLVLKARTAAYDTSFNELRSSLRSTFESL
jgi:ribonuclease P protein component